MRLNTCGITHICILSSNCMINDSWNRQSCQRLLFTLLSGGRSWHSKMYVGGTAWGKELWWAFNHGQRGLSANTLFNPGSCYRLVIYCATVEQETQNPKKLLAWKVWRECRICLLCMYIAAQLFGFLDGGFEDAPCMKSIYYRCYSKRFGE